MYLHINKYIYCVYFNDSLIVLNLKKNQYLVLPESYAEIMHIVLDHEYGQYDKGGSPDDFDAIVEELQNMGIFSRQKYGERCDYTLVKKGCSAGAPNVDWRMRKADGSIVLSRSDTFKAYLYLLKVYFILKVFGFYSLIKSIKKSGKTGVNEVDAGKFDKLVAALNRACFYFPTRVKCLEWSAALVFMGLKRGLKCNIEIGVQNLPFVAHAWVRAGGSVVADDESLPENLSVILSEPYR
ncbi:MAG: lasso peptide biosynthesis B2 protein [Phycisphaerales bacterium]|nr:lasso peptide biosynthesis B2 protein [Phycisphaerales bacterium]